MNLKNSKFLILYEKEFEGKANSSCQTKFAFYKYEMPNQLNLVQFKTNLNTSTRLLGLNFHNFIVSYVFTTLKKKSVS